MPVLVSTDSPVSPYEQVRVPAAAWDRLIGVAWERGWSSKVCPRGFEDAHLDADEAWELIECYDEARDEQWDHYGGGDLRGRPPEWATDLPDPEELRGLARSGGLRVAPCL